MEPDLRRPLRATASAPAFPPESLLGRCGPEGVDALVKHWTEANYASGAPIVGADDTDDDVFFVLEGCARAATYTDTGREVRLSDIPKGEGFGIFAAVDGRPRSTNVSAIGTSRFARLSAASFNQVIDTNPQVARALMLYLIDRVRELSVRMTEVATLSAEARLVQALASLSRPVDQAFFERLGRTVIEVELTADAAAIDPLPTQQDIATTIMSQRETVGREMSRLTKLGLIHRQGRALLIPSVEALRASVGRRHDGDG
ncbi:MAG: Crp/Fnr family transcriptional regulator [Pseudomonadota bacterium]